MSTDFSKKVSHGVSDQLARLDCCPPHGDKRRTRPSAKTVFFWPGRFFPVDSLRQDLYTCCMYDAAGRRARIPRVMRVNMREKHNVSSVDRYARADLNGNGAFRACRTGLTSLLQSLALRSWFWRYCFLLRHWKHARVFAVLHKQLGRL